MLTVYRDWKFLIGHTGVSATEGHVGLPERKSCSFLSQKLVISFITRGDITWQESSQCVTESRLPAQTRRLSVVGDVQRHPDMLSVRRERRAAFCGQQKSASKYATIQSRQRSQFYNQPAEIPSLAYLSQRRGYPHVIWSPAQGLKSVSSHLSLTSYTCAPASSVSLQSPPSDPFSRVVHIFTSIVASASRTIQRRACSRFFLIANLSETVNESFD